MARARPAEETTTWLRSALSPAPRTATAARSRHHPQRQVGEVRRRRRRQREGSGLPRHRRWNGVRGGVKKTSDKGNDYLSVKLDDLRRSGSNLMRAWWRAKRGSGAHLVAPSRRRLRPATSEAPRKRASSCSYPPPQDKEYGELSHCSDRLRLKPLPIEVGKTRVLPLAPANAACCGAGPVASQNGRSPRRHHIVIRSARLAAWPPRAGMCPLHPARSRAPEGHVGDMPSALTGKDRTMNFISSSQTPQAVNSGFRVDISRGQRIGRVSSEWFSPRTISVICRSARVLRCREDARGS